MDKDEGKPDAQGREEAQLPQNGEIGKTESGKRPHRREGRQQPHGPDLLCGLRAPGLSGPVQKQEVGDAVIDGDRDDGAAKSQGHDRKPGIDQAADQKSGGGAGQRRQECQKPHPGAGKGNNQQQGDPQGGQHDRPPHVAPGDKLVVQRRPIGSGRRHGEPVSRLCRGLPQIARDVGHQGGQPPGEGRIGSRGRGMGDHEQVPAVRGKELSLVDPDRRRRRQKGEPGHDRILEPERILRDHAGPADALQPQKGPADLLQAPPDGVKAQARADLRFKLAAGKQHRQVVQNVRGKLRNEILDILHPHLPEEPAGGKRLFHRVSVAGQQVRRLRFQADIDDELVLNGMVGENHAGIRDDRVFLGQVPGDVGVDVGEMESGRKKGRDHHPGQEEQGKPDAAHRAHQAASAQAAVRWAAAMRRRRR